MFDEHTEIEKNYGTIFIDEKEVGNTYYELTYNPLCTNEMKIVLVNPQLPFIQLLAERDKKISVLTKLPNSIHKIELNPHRFEGAVTDRNIVITSSVQEYSIERNYSFQSKEPYIHLVFGFPLTGLTDDFLGEMKHSDYGLIRGEYNEEIDEISPIKTDFSIKTAYGDFKIVGHYKFFDLPSSNLYSSIKLVRSSICYVKLSFNKSEYKSKIANTIKFVDKLFSFIGFLERDRIYWTSKFLSVNNSNENNYTEITTYRWCPPVTEEYYKDIKDQDKKKFTMSSMISAFEKMNDKEKCIMSEMLQSLEIANCAQTIETKLIHYHSCIDFFRNKFNKKKGSFSKDVIELLDERKISISDLIEEETLQNIRNKVKNKSTFEFTNLRNRYLHEGFDAFQDNYDSVMRQNDIMRCICERFILNCLGINYKDTVLGTK
jgi:hypothetical protein